MFNIIKNTLKKRINTKIKGKNNIIRTYNNSPLPDELEIIIEGNDNTIIIDEKIFFQKSKIEIYSSGNYVEIKPTKHLVILNIYIKHGDKQKCIIDEGFSSAGLTVWLIEPDCFLKIGKDCMLSTDIHFITSDGHCIYNESTSDDKIINSSFGVEIGNHVWIGTHARILKNTIIPDNSIVGAGSVVAKAFTQKNVIIAGNPALIVKEQIRWDRKSINNYRKEQINEKKY